MLSWPLPAEVNTGKQFLVTNVHLLSVLMLGPHSVYIFCQWWCVAQVLCTSSVSVYAWPKFCAHFLSVLVLGPSFKTFILKFMKISLSRKWKTGNQQNFKFNFSFFERWMIIIGETWIQNQQCKNQKIKMLRNKQIYVI